VIKRHVSEVVEDSEATTLDSARSLKDYGATSLDMVEIVSASMRQLKVKVPRSELNGIGNIDGLIDVLYQAVQAKG
jgi:acyl carrier protein